jgi:hypothetical protein
MQAWMTLLLDAAIAYPPPARARPRMIPTIRWENLLGSFMFQVLAGYGSKFVAGQGMQPLSGLWTQPAPADPLDPAVSAVEGVGAAL